MLKNEHMDKEESRNPTHEVQLVFDVWTNATWLALSANLYNFQKMMVLPFLTPPLPSTSSNHNLSFSSKN